MNTASDVGANRTVRRGGWLRKLFLLGVVTVLTLGLAEAALWVVAPVRVHEWMFWVPDGRIRARAEPNQFIENRYGGKVRVNQYGFRGADYSMTPAPGTVRILTFGGSSTFCFENGEGATWPDRLGAILSERLKTRVEVINLGLPGFDSTQSKTNYMFFGRALHPHVVLQYDTWNDMKFFRVLEHEPDTFKFWVPNRPWWQLLIRSTQLGRYARQAYWNRTGRQMETFFNAGASDTAAWNRPTSRHVYEWERKNFEDFALLAKTDGVLAVQVNQAMTVTPENCKRDEYRPILSRALKEMGMTPEAFHEAFLNVTRSLEETTRRYDSIYVDAWSQVAHDFEMFYDTVHFTDRGSDRMAHVIADTLAKDSRFLAVVERVGKAAATQP